MVKRVIVIVLDSVGIGELPDAADFGDVGSNTLGHIAQTVAGFRLPHLESSGIGNISRDVFLPPTQQPKAAFGRAMEKSPGKDTTTGHWEIAGLVLEQAFPTFPQGFPADFLSRFEAAIGSKTLGNTTASGTVIINELGDEHVQSGCPIVYTSADSVFQIAMHEEVIPIERQYEICRIAREMLSGPLAVGRVIARPFIGSSGNYTRTANRRDFSLVPPAETILKLTQNSGKEVMAVGKIWDIYAYDGMTQHIKTANNMEGVDRTLEYMNSGDEGLIFTNLVDFDMLYGHRRDPEGYAQCLIDFDNRLPELLSAMTPEDVMIITADHGNDPTFSGTDHTREYIPVLVYGDSLQAGANFGTRSSFADIGASIADMLQLPPTPCGESFYPLIKKEELQ